jgi:hypothetical protein
VRGESNDLDKEPLVIPVLLDAVLSKVNHLGEPNGTDKETGKRYKEL